jgi:hypothetical protein
MPVKKKPLISAQIILIPASGRPIDGRTVITEGNIEKFFPPQNAFSAVSAEFRSKGFEVEPLVGISFSITGTIKAFEEYFGMRIRLAGDNAYEFLDRNNSMGHELSGRNLPHGLSKFVLAVTFPLPPDFGPTEFHK